MSEEKFDIWFKENVASASDAIVDALNNHLSTTMAFAPKRLQLEVLNMALFHTAALVNCPPGLSRDEHEAYFRGLTTPHEFFEEIVEQMREFKSISDGNEDDVQAVANLN